MGNFVQDFCEKCGVIQTHHEEENGLRCVICQTIQGFICVYCGGSGGFDKSRDCEVYDDWHDCPECEGKGRIGGLL
jgi:hypothetical protein